MATVTIVGAGYMGTALAYPLSDNGHAVRLVGTHLDGEIISNCLAGREHPRLKRRIPKGVLPYYVEAMFEYSTTLIEAELAWVKGFIKQLEEKK